MNILYTQTAHSSVKSQCAELIFKRLHCKTSPRKLLLLVAPPVQAIKCDYVFRFDPCLLTINVKIIFNVFIENTNHEFYRLKHMNLHYTGLGKCKGKNSAEFGFGQIQTKKNATHLNLSESKSMSEKFRTNLDIIPYGHIPIGCIWMSGGQGV